MPTDFFDITPLWTLEEGLAMARHLEIVFDKRFHVALGGSVLHKGQSFKDLDLLVYPRMPANTVDEMRGLLPEADLTLLKRRDEVRAGWAYGATGDVDDKWVEFWGHKDRRI